MTASRRLAAATISLVGCLSACVELDEPASLASAGQATTRAEFDERWFGGHRRKLDYLCQMLASPHGSTAFHELCEGVPYASGSSHWVLHDWAEALASMYEATRDPAYLDALEQMGDILVAGRSSVLGVVDPIRGGVQSGWVNDADVEDAITKEHLGTCTEGGLALNGMFAGMLTRHARLVAQYVPDLEANRARRDKAALFAGVAAEVILDWPLAESSVSDGAMRFVRPVDQETPAYDLCYGGANEAGLAPEIPYNKQHTMASAMLDLIVADELGVAVRDNRPILGVALARVQLPMLWKQWIDDAVDYDQAPSGAEYAYFRRWPDGIGGGEADDISHAAITMELVGNLTRFRGSITRSIGQLDVPAGLNNGLVVSLDEVITSSTAGLRQFHEESHYTATPTMFGLGGGACRSYLDLVLTRRSSFTRCDEVIGDNLDAAGGDGESSYARLLWARSYRDNPGWIAWSGRTAWDPVSVVPAGLKAVVGDFDDDEADDVLYQDANRWLYVAWEGRGAPQTLFRLDRTLDQIRVGDFDGNGTSDLLYSVGTVSATTSWRAYPGLRTRAGFGPSVHVQTSDIPVTALVVGDFDNIAGDDLLQVRASGDLKISYSTGAGFAHGTWRLKGNLKVSVSSLRVGDFDGDQYDDLFYASGGQWWVAYGVAGLGLFLAPRSVASSAKGVASLGFGHFDSGPSTDVLTITSDGWRVLYGGQPDRRLSGAVIVNDVDIGPIGDLLIGDFQRDGLSDVLDRRPP